MEINIYYQYAEEIDIKARDELIKIAMKKKRNLRESHKSPRFSPAPKEKKRKKTKKKGRKRKREDTSKEEKEDIVSDEEEEDVRLTEPPKKRQKGKHSWWQKPDIQQYYKELKEKTGYTPPKNPYTVSEQTPTIIDIDETDDEDEEEEQERQSDEEEAEEEESGDEDIDMRERGVSFTIFNSVIHFHFQYY